MAERQDVNSVERFRKRPGRLVLEEYSHCEVPAGCGGVVLRWRNPAAVVPVLLHVYAPVEVGGGIDGAPLPTGRVDLAPGDHVAAFVLENVNLSAGLFMFAAMHEPRADDTAVVNEPPFRVLSAGDWTWRFSLVVPPDGWTSRDFDDSNWPALVAVPTPELDWQAHGAYQSQQCAHLGAACLAIPRPPGQKGDRAWWGFLLGPPHEPADPPSTGTVWIRKVFHIPPPVFRDSQPGAGGVESK